MADLKKYRNKVTGAMRLASSHPHPQALYEPVVERPVRAERKTTEAPAAKTTKTE